MAPDFDRGKIAQPKRASSQQRNDQTVPILSCLVQGLGSSAALPIS